MRLSYFALLPLVSLVLAQDTSIREVKRAFDAANIPEDLNIDFEPEVLFEVSLPQEDKTLITLHAGVQVDRDDTAGPPIFGVRAPEKGPFVVITVDPDAPTPQNPTSAQIRHFLGGNFLNDRGILLNNTPAISEFLQPTPPAGSDAHRYVFLLFRQSRQFNSQTEVNSTTSVSLFDVAKFAADTGLGKPIGGTFMLVAPDA
ncbi:PEBP-like protein [Marasmius fiardii PR-910]|nr:PEBP-like protein [Marasmius fiardii PR-910]